MEGPTIWGGPLPHREAFHEHDVVFVEGFNRVGTIVSNVTSPGHYGLQPGVLVEFDSGEGLPGNDRVQWVAVSDLRHKES